MERAKHCRMELEPEQLRTGKGTCDPDSRCYQKAPATWKRVTETRSQTNNGRKAAPNQGATIQDRLEIPRLESTEYSAE
jgi:hypothetical protein